MCRGCKVLVNPVSFERGLKTRPHFREYQKDPHKFWCKIEGETELIRAAKSKSIQNEQGFPCSFPHTLELTDSRSKVEPEDEQLNPNESKSRSTSNSSSNSNNTSISKWIARTIRPIARTYINFPKDRDLPLTISGLEGSIYKDVIRKLSSQEVVIYTRQHLFYAPIAWAAPTKTTNSINIKLSYGYWLGGKLLQPYSVKIDITGWSQAKIAYVLEELEVARHDAMQAKNKNKFTKTKSWLFFIGQQSSHTPEEFVINDHRLICCLTTDAL